MGAVTVGDDHVRVGERVVARKDVRIGFFEPGPPMQVIVMTKDGEIGMAMPDADTSKAALRALGVDVNHKAVHFERVTARTRRTWAFFVVLMMMCFGGAIGDCLKGTSSSGGGVIALGLIVTTIVLAWYVGRARPPIDIGSDGVRVEGRFIPIDEIKSVVANVHPCHLGHANCFEANVTMNTAGGEVIVPFPGDDPKAAERARAIAERIREAMNVEGAPAAESTILDHPIENVAAARLKRDRRTEPALQRRVRIVEHA